MADTEHPAQAAAAESTATAQRVLAGLAEIRADVEDLYRDLHRHPELSGEEHRTASVAAERLRGSGFEVTENLGGTGVVGILTNGEGPTVLVRADMDALPVTEATGLDHASGTDGVMHACGHDVHVAGLVGAAELLSRSRADWSGTLVALFQPAEETATGARDMVDDGLVDRVPRPDVALAQHVLAFPAGRVGTRSGPMLTTADSIRITIPGRGAHGSMPHAAVDPVVVAAATVLRLQTIVAREIAPGEPAVVTVGSVRAGEKSNVIPDSAELLVNTRCYGDDVRDRVLGSIERIVRAEAAAGGCPTEPTFEYYDHFPVTDNDPGATARVADAFAGYFGDDAEELPQQSASEDFSDIPAALGTPYSYWAIGGIDPDAYAAAERAGRVAQDIPVNHSALFAPVLQPTLDRGVGAIVVAVLAWLGR